MIKKFNELYENNNEPSIDELKRIMTIAVDGTIEYNTSFK